ncbi:hypothetical protein ACQ4PT_021615 [Festuca glaucescens]
MPMAADWSSLPSELLGLVTDALLATDDVDCYVSLRAVCHHWRDTTTDPQGPDPRFLPRRWVMLGWPAASAGDSRRLFLNVDTGLFVWKDMPMLRDHACVATDNDGLLVLQGPTDYNNFSALNPFTGAWIYFPPISSVRPQRTRGRRRLVADGDAIQLQQKLHSTALDSFASVVCCQGRVYAMDRKGTVVFLEDRWKITTIVTGDWQEDWHPAFLMDNAGELLVVRALTFWDIVQVFRVDLENKAVHMINSIRNRAIFLGNRSLSVDASNLPAIEANFIYYIGGAGLYELHVYRLEPSGHEEPSKRIDIVLPAPIAVWYHQHQVSPLSLSRLIMGYATYGSLTRVGLVI